jgi:thioredoxin 1
MREIIDNDISELDNDCYHLLYFTASWCGPCKRIYPLIEQLSDGFDEEIIKIFKVDIDNNDELSEKLNIKSVPTFFLYKRKEYIDQCGGSDILKVKELLKNINNED